MSQQTANLKMVQLGAGSTPDPNATGDTHCTQQAEGQPISASHSETDGIHRPEGSRECVHPYRQLDRFTTPTAREEPSVTTQTGSNNSKLPLIIGALARTKQSSKKNKRPTGRGGNKEDKGEEDEERGKVRGEE